MTVMNAPPFSSTAVVGVTVSGGAELDAVDMAICASGRAAIGARVGSDVDPRVSAITLGSYETTSRRRMGVVSKRTNAGPPECVSFLRWLTRKSVECGK